MTLTLDAHRTPAQEPAHRRSRQGERGWTKPALWLLLAGTAVLYLWNLSASGWANEFYAAAAQAGSQSPKAWLFASLDAGNAITVDKPPAALWVMGLSMRLFGVHSWALLVPQALEGVASVALLYAAVRRWFGPVAGLLAGAVLAVTPVAVVMFRFDNPDALLTLLLVAGAYTTVRALEKASWRWLALTGALLGFAFLTKMLQAFLVLPGFGLAYLVAAPAGLARRIRDLVVAGLALVIGGGWFVLLVSIWPAASRPYIAGSTNNSLWQLAIGYNGLGRIFGGSGNAGGGPGGGGGNNMFGGAAGIGRMFGTAFGLEISWLLPAALVAGVALFIGTLRAPRTDRTRAAAVLWGGWVLVTGLTFSYMSGTTHPYYAVALAPGIAATVAIGARVLWGWRDRFAARVGLAAMVLATGLWDYVLLGRVSWAPGLRWVILAGGVVVAAALLVPVRRLGRFAAVLAAVTVLPLGLGSAAWGVATAGHAHSGATPTSGPAGVGMSGSAGPGGGFGAFLGGNPGGIPAGAFPGGTSGAVPGTPSGRSGQDAGSRRTPAGNGPGSGAGSADTALVALLKGTDNRWAAATNGSMQSAPLQLASGKAVMAIGGFTGSDPSPTLAQFQAYVQAGAVHYYISGGRSGGPGGDHGEGSQIAQWVAAHYTATTVGSSTVYDLTGRTTA